MTLKTVGGHGVSSYPKPTPRRRGQHTPMSAKTERRMQPLLVQAPSHTYAQAMLKLVKMEAKSKLSSTTTALTLSFRGPKDRENQHLPLRLEHAPYPEDWTSIANHLTRWLKTFTQNPLAYADMGRVYARRTHDRFWVTLTLPPQEKPPCVPPQQPAAG